MTKLHFVSISLASSELPHGQLSFSTVLSYRKQFNSYLYPVLLQKVASWLISRRFLRGWKQDIIAKSRTLDPPTFVIDHSSILIIELENPDVFDCVHVSKTCNASSREKFLECKICDLYSIQKEVGLETFSSKKEGEYHPIESPTCVIDYSSILINFSRWKANARLSNSITFFFLERKFWNVEWKTRDFHFDISIEHGI